MEYPLTVTDTTGHAVTLEKMPEKIVIAGKATLMVQDAIFMFEEAQTRVVGIENRGQSVFTFLPYVDPTLDDKDSPGEGCWTLSRSPRSTRIWS